MWKEGTGCGIEQADVLAHAAEELGAVVIPDLWRHVGVSEQVDIELEVPTPHPGVASDACDRGRDDVYVTAQDRLDLVIHALRHLKEPDEVAVQPPVVAVDAQVRSSALVAHLGVEEDEILGDLDPDVRVVHDVTIRPARETPVEGDARDARKRNEERRDLAGARHERLARVERGFRRGRCDLCVCRFSPFDERAGTESGDADLTVADEQVPAVCREGGEAIRHSPALLVEPGHVRIENQNIDGVRPTDLCGVPVVGADVPGARDVTTHLFSKLLSKRQSFLAHLLTSVNRLRCISSFVCQS